MLSTFFSIGAAILAVAAEYLYCTLPGPWWKFLWIWTPIQLGIGYCIYRLVSMPGQPLLGALLLWSFAVIGTRALVSTFLLKDHVSPGLWAAVGLMVAARVVQVVWK
jgi:hypothetical protein